MANDFDVLAIQVFSEIAVDPTEVIDTVVNRVNGFLTGYPAERVVSIVPQVTETDNWFRYIVTVTLKS
jgi:hypothetical protein